MCLRVKGFLTCTEVVVAILVSCAHDNNDYLYFAQFTFTLSFSLSIPFNIYS